MDGFLNLVPKLIHVALKLVDSEKGHQIGHSAEENTNTDKNGEGFTGNLRIDKTQNAKRGGNNAEKADAPPVAETELLEIERLDKQRDTFHHHPKRKHKRQRDRHGRSGGKKEYTKKNLQQGRKHTSATVRKKHLRPERENQGKQAGNQNDTA